MEGRPDPAREQGNLFAMIEGNKLYVQPFKTLEIQFFLKRYCGLCRAAKCKMKRICFNFVLRKKSD